MEWELILGYVCFCLGLVLLLFGFGRLIWWGVTSRRKPHRPRTPGPHILPSYYKDPWLRAPSLASIISRDKDDHPPPDTEEIYALPADHDPRGVYLRRPSPATDPETSQTESQIYGNHLDQADLGDPWSSNIYSVLSRAPRLPAAAPLPEEDDDFGPEVPDRGYLGARDGGSLTEADRASMREIAYVDPPTDYSPERRIPNLRTMERATRGGGRDVGGWVAVSSTPNGHASLERDGVDDSQPLELSGDGLYRAAVFRNSSGEEVPAPPHTPGAGSIKSMKSLYQFMYTEEPCALDNEMEYSFTSTVH